jgi:RimJ/RimL family protein N-acetyltransferase
VTVWDGRPILTTPRLILRTYREDDLPLFAALNADPAVMATLGGEPLTREHSDDIAAWAQERFAEERIGLLAVERREDGAFVGMCGLHHQRAYPDDLEIAWRLAHRYWGYGYATEAATAWLGYAFDVLQVPRVISITDRPNVRSLAVMQRLGMTLDHEADVEDDGIMFHALIHTLTADRWRRAGSERNPS